MALLDTGMRDAIKAAMQDLCREDEELLNDYNSEWMS
jgi:hypothetical protein